MNLTYSTIKYFWRNLRIWLVQNKAYIEASVWWNSFFNEMTSFCCCSCFHGLFSYICITSLLSNTFWCYVLQRWRHIYTRTSFIQWTPEILFSFLISWKEISYIKQYVYFSSGQITDQVMSGIPVRVYEPESSIQQTNRPVLLYLHGGGWAFLSIGKRFLIVFFSTSSIWIPVMFNFKRRIDFVDNYDHLCQKLAKDANIVVISVEWVHA